MEKWRPGVQRGSLKESEPRMSKPAKTMKRCCAIREAHHNSCVGTPLAIYVNFLSRTLMNRA